MKVILLRLLVVLLTLLLVSFSVFALEAHSLGDSAMYVFSEEASGEALERYREQEGLTGPLLLRYCYFLASFLKGEWGVSAGGQDIKELVLSRASVTVFLALSSLILAVLLSVPLSILGARKGTFWSLAVPAMSMAVMSVPSFLIALSLVMLFSVSLGWFPVAGYIPPYRGFFSFLRSLFLPSLTLALMHASLYMKVFRKALRENSEKPFSKAMVALGLRKSLVPLRSALKPSLPVLYSLVAETFASSLAGAAVVETVFALPGLGSLLVSAALSRDLALSGTLMMLASLSVSLVSLSLDIVLYYSDPRRRAL